MATETLPRKIIELNRSIASTAAQKSGSVLRTAGAGANRVAHRARTAGATVVGQARSAIERTTHIARQGGAEVSGQVEAQGGAVADTAGREAHSVVDRAQREVDGTPPPGTPYEEWTRDRLYERAQERDIKGRASMNKTELIRSLRR